MTRLPLARLIAVAGTAAVLSTSALAATPGADEIPEPLKGIVFGASKRHVDQTPVNGVAFSSMRVFSDLPYLLWPTEAAGMHVFAAEPEELGAWLLRGAGDLGFEGFEPRYLESYQWKTNEVWVYELVRDGAPLHDARIEAHWNAGELVGILNHTSGRIVAIDEHDAGVEREARVFYQSPAEGGQRALAATAARERLADRSVLKVLGADGTVLEVEHSPDLVMNHREVIEFTEYPVPQGTFPDQISVAPDGKVWFSEPNIDHLYFFDPVAEAFSRYPTTGASGPDGMIVGSGERVWTGMYYSGGLGLMNRSTGAFTEYPPPYGGAAMAIPVECSDGMVWVTDHANNKISEFNPATGQFVKTLNMPTANCWVVQGHEDTVRGQVYFTEYNANKLGRIALGGSTVTDLTTPGGGPAFCVYTSDKVYYSRWNENGIGVYDINSNSFTEYQFPVAGENGGPLWLRPNGDIVCGTLNRGYVMVFDVSAQTFTAMQIPTSFPGLKDGMTVGADDVIWFTETGARKLGKLVFCPETCCVADFNSDGTVNTLDVLAFLNAWNAGDPRADVNEDGELNTLDVLAFLNLWNAGC